MAQITYANKTSGDTFTAANANEIKEVVNTNAPTYKSYVANVVLNENSSTEQIFINELGPIYYSVSSNQWKINSNIGVFVNNKTDVLVTTLNGDVTLFYNINPTLINVGASIGGTQITAFLFRVEIRVYN